MAIYRYIVTVDVPNPTYRTGATLQGEIDANIESVIFDYGIEHFTVEPLSAVYLPTDSAAPLSPDGRYNS